MHVSGRGRGIAELDLGAVFASEEERSALSLVKSLDLSHNLLTHISALHPLGSLQTLNLSHNRITTMRSLPLTLTNIDLSFNQLTTLEGLAGLPCLEQLDVSHNRLHSLSSLSGQPHTLRVLRASANRIASTDGIATHLNLKVLLLDHNLVASPDALLCLKPLEQLEVTSFADCPVASVNGYRDYVVRMQPNLLSVDGAPTLGESRPSSQRGPQATRRLNDSTSTTRKSLNPQIDRNVSADTSNGGIHPPSASASAQHDEQGRNLRRELHDAALLLEQEQRDHSRTKQQLRKAESQLHESKRLIREQLEELVSLRQEREAQHAHVQSLRAKVDQLLRNAKYERERHHTETMRLAVEYEKDRTIHDVHVSDLRQRIADVSSINSSRVHGGAGELSRRSTKAHLNDSKAADRATRDDGDEEEEAAAAGALAKQLKDWLCTEVRRQAKTDRRDAEEEDRTPAAVEHSPRTAARNITDLWKRSEEQGRSRGIDKRRPMV